MAQNSASRGNPDSKLLLVMNLMGWIVCILHLDSFSDSSGASWIMTQLWFDVFSACYCTHLLFFIRKLVRNTLLTDLRSCDLLMAPCSVMVGAMYTHALQLGFVREKITLYTDNAVPHINS